MGVEYFSKEFKELVDDSKNLDEVLLFMQEIDKEFEKVVNQIDDISVKKYIEEYLDLYPYSFNELKIDAINEFDYNKKLLEEFIIANYGEDVLEEIGDMDINSSQEFLQEIQEIQEIQEQLDKEQIEEYIVANYGEDVLAKLDDDSIENNQISNEELQRIQEQIEKENQEKLERREKFFEIAGKIAFSAAVFNVAKDFGEVFNDKIKDFKDEGHGL